MTVLCEKSERGSPYMFTANGNWSLRGNERSRLRTRLCYVLACTACLMAFLASPRASCAQVPTYEFTPVESSIKFGVDSSVSIKGAFEKWNASIKFSSRDIRSAVLDIEIEADSVNTGSHVKDNKLKGQDFFNAKESPLITFQSTKIVQTGPNTFDIEGNFTDGETHSHERQQRNTHRQSRWHHGFRSQRIRHDERHPFHQDRQPRRGKCSTEVAPCRRSATSFPTIACEDRAQYGN